MAITGTGDVQLDQTAFNRIAYLALRAELYYDAIADVEPTEQAMPGVTVSFTKVNDLAAAITPLTEATDVTPATMSDVAVTVPLLEYGNAAQTTAKLRGTNFVSIDDIAANLIGYNAGVSVDTVARDVLAAGTNVTFSGNATSRLTIDGTDNMSGSNGARAVARLRDRSVPTINGFYWATIHPLVSYDLRQTTGAGSWRDPHQYSQPGEIWAGEIGAFEGARYIETPRAPLFPNAGTPATVDVYRTIFGGRQALAKVWSMIDGNGPQPQVVFGPVTDVLRRFQPVGWYWLGGYGIFRQESLDAVESASTLGANV